MWIILNILLCLYSSPLRAEGKETAPTPASQNSATLPAKKGDASAPGDNKTQSKGEATAAVENKAHTEEPEKTNLNPESPANSPTASDSLSKEIELRKVMLDWSRQLGVTCNYCHDTNNFKNSDKPSFKVAQKHKQMIYLLNQEVFTDRDKGGTLKVVADCFMCHRGLAQPKYKEPPQNLMQ